MATAELLKLQPESSQEKTKRLSVIERHECTQLSYNEFFWDFMNANWPVVLTGVSTDWECRNNWVTPNNNDNHRSITPINFDYLKSKVGNCHVPVANCSVVYFNSHAKKEMLFFDFLDYWQAKLFNANTTTQESNTGEHVTQPPTSSTTENLYLKDWHLKAQMPEYDFYRVPKHFASDWLNEHLVTVGQDDYRFVYMGPKQSWTPFHSDVFGSYSWSTNILGCKKWILLPPGEELKLSDNLGNLPFSIDETLLRQKQVQFTTLYQGENEALFVPSGWYHQVWNLTDTISINHNWFNACNVQHIWQNLSANMRQVIAEIDDCRQMDNFDEHCQTMLRASFGKNYLDFVDLLEFITDRRLGSYNNGNVEPSSNKYLFLNSFTPNDFHMHHDLQSIRTVVKEMLQDAVVCDSRTILYRRCLRLMELTAGF